MDMDSSIVEASLRALPESQRAAHIIERLFRDFRGAMSVRFWDGHTIAIGQGAPRFTLVFRDPARFRAWVLSRDPLRLAEAHFSGELDIEGDIYEALSLRHHLVELRLSARDKASLLAHALRIRSVPPSAAEAGESVHARAIRARSTGRHSRASDRRAIAFHYDISDAFYALWLDEQMVYSCAYFEHPDESLDQAQRNKLDHICRKLRLRAGENLLDIGCGWGALVRWAARHYGVKAHGITLSRNQYEYARRRIRDEGLDGLVEVELRDYRDLPGQARYDKIASVGMFEHVGLKNLPLYFATAQRLLKPGGLFLNHGITTDSDGWRTSVATQFINRYVFPDGELDTVGNVQRVMEGGGFEVLDLEALRPHYALTLRRWVRRLEARRDEALEHVNEATYRVWRLYMAACALQFEAGAIGVYQILGARRGGAANPVPLTRRDLYPQARCSERAEATDATAEGI